VALLTKVSGTTAHIDTRLTAKPALPKVIIWPMLFAYFLFSSARLFYHTFLTEQFFWVDIIKGKGLSTFVLASEKRRLVLEAHVVGHLADHIESRS
jgi:hypothetical protein